MAKLLGVWKHDILSRFELASKFVADSRTAFFYQIRTSSVFSMWLDSFNKEPGSKPKVTTVTMGTCLDKLPTEPGRRIRCQTSLGSASRFDSDQRPPAKWMCKELENHLLDESAGKPSCKYSLSLNDAEPSLKYSASWLPDHSQTLCFMHSSRLRFSPRNVVVRETTSSLCCLL